jgi:catechol 2,3-dioxygenase-like lactoylglutathione lyase family enzyme
VKPDPVSAITLFTDDLTVSKAFYVNAFGEPPVFEDPDSAVFSFGGVMVNLLSATAAPEVIEPATVGTGARALLTITVDDVDAICDDLRARGVALLNGPVDRPWGVRTACFADPSGHLWEIAR